jgi:hypothetical protein
MADKTPIKFAAVRRENRRIEVLIFKTDEGHAAVIYTKRLLDKKTRHILESQVSYSFETLAVLMDVLVMLFDDPEFRKATNREGGQIPKWSMSTNIKR